MWKRAYHRFPEWLGAVVYEDPWLAGGHNGLSNSEDPLKPEDAAKLSAMRDGVVRLCEGADLVIYDTQFTPEEYKSRPHWGHSRPDDAIEIAREAKVKQLCLFHHAPLRSDDENDAILARYRETCRAANDKFELHSAYEGLELALGDE